MPHAAPILSRRAWLRLGGLALGLLPPAWLLPFRTTASTARPAHPGFGKARSVLVVFTGGGQSQLDTWDPKPNAPEEVRGAFGTIATAVPGTRLCEHLPRLARLTDRYTILRSVSHDDLEHGSAIYQALTGHPHPRKSSNPPPQPTDYPTFGSLVRRVGSHARLPYSAVHVNGPLLVPREPGPGQGGGFLGRGYDPLVLGDVSAGPVVLGGMDPLPDLSPHRRETRRELLETLERADANGPPDRAGRALAQSYRQAYDLLASAACRRAFDLSREPLATREAYGRHRSGQACLLARRLVEAGVPWVTVFLNHNIRGQDLTPEREDAYGWDTHNDIFESMREKLLPRFDQGFAALLADLEQRGLLGETLVVCMGEFGRAPRVAVERRFAGTTPGRKHWAAVYSVVLSGAGIGRGGLAGSSDRSGAYPASDPVGPWDVAATLFAALGIDPSSQYQDLTGRPSPLTLGVPIRAVYG